MSETTENKTEGTTLEQTTQAKEGEIIEGSSQEITTSDGETVSTTVAEASENLSNMSMPFIGLSSMQFIFAILLIIVVLQQSKTATGITSSAIIGSGENQSYWNKNKSRSKESKLARLTVIFATIFFILTISLGFIK